MNYESTFDNNTYTVKVNEKNQSFSLNGEEKKYHFRKLNDRFLLRVGTKQYKIDNVHSQGSLIEFTIDGEWFEVEVKDEQDLLLDRLGFKTGSAVGEGVLKAPMPGQILEIMVSEGDQVTEGQPLAILEAMKMENELKAPVSGTISSIHVEEGQSLEKNSPIIEIE